MYGGNQMKFTNQKIWFLQLKTMVGVLYFGDVSLTGDQVRVQGIMHKEQYLSIL